MGGKRRGHRCPSLLCARNPDTIRILFESLLLNNLTALELAELKAIVESAML